MKIYPLYDKVVIERIELENKSTGGIVLTGSSISKSIKGKIIAIGKGRLLDNGKLKSLEVKVGDIVIFNDTYSNKIDNIENKEIIIISEGDILAIVK